VEDAEVLNGDIYGQISPYVTANYWWWPGQKKFHLRTYEVVPNSNWGTAFQSTFSVTELEGNTARTLLDAGQNASAPNFFSEGVFYALWGAPNFHDKVTNLPLLFWPVTGWSYDVLIGGLYPGTQPEWNYNLHGKTLELAAPVTMANQLLKRVRQLFDEAAANGTPVTSTYRSGINIKFGKAFDNLLGQTVPTDNADWSKGTIMFDFPSYRPTTGDHHRYNEAFYDNLIKVLVNEFPVRPHWTKNTRETFKLTVKNLNPDRLARFAKVRKQFDPQGTFKSVVGEIIGVM
jgi:hypothetical protein